MSSPSQALTDDISQLSRAQKIRLVTELITDHCNILKHTHTVRIYRENFEGLVEVR